MASTDKLPTKETMDIQYLIKLYDMLHGDPEMRNLGMILVEDLLGNRSFSREEAIAEIARAAYREGMQKGREWVEQYAKVIISAKYAAIKSQSFEKASFLRDIEKTLPTYKLKKL
jgi:hypothetical protein